MNQQLKVPELSTGKNPGPKPAELNPKAVPYRPKVPYDKFAWLKKYTAAQIASIFKDDLKADANQVDSKSGFDVLCSYNWHTAETASIYVPGAPPKWTTRQLPFTLQPDQGQHYIDQNAHQVPDYPFEPIFRALPFMSPDFKFNKIDFVSNRNSMRKLLNFVNGSVDEPFRIDLNVIQNTLFFTRRERRTLDIIRGPQKFPGFGHGFEEEFTTPQQGLENSTSHHRVVRYKFGDLDCVMRYEVDAWMDSKNDGEEDGNRSNAEAETTNDENDLLASLKGLSLNQDEPTLKKVHERATKVIAQGTPIDADRLAELKSRSKMARKRDMTPQLWFGRIPYLVIGTHEKGTIGEVVINNTANDFETFETQQQENLRKLVSVIRRLRDLTKSRPDKACIVVCDPKNKPLQLSIYASTGRRPVLPPELMRSYWTSNKRR